MAIPHATTLVPDWLRARAAAGRMLLALDFDGTLAPIVPRPDDAALPTAAREVLARLAADPRVRIAIVSGRSLADARARIAIDGLFFAGNHGLEIEGPGVHRDHPQALATRPALERCLHRLRARFADHDEVIIEDKGLTLSVHFRLVAEPARAQAIIRQVHESCEGVDGIRLTHGKMVVEIRPAVEWDKGRATDFLIATLLPDSHAAPTVFIGDDRTDEDAFRTLAGRGDGIIVADPPPPDTAATGYVRSPREVVNLLELLAGDAGHEAG